MGNYANNGIINYAHGGKDMDTKTKKIVFIASMIIFVLVIFSFFYSIKNTNAFETRTGSLFYKIGIVNEGNTKFYKWDIGITKNNIKSGIIENESNEKFLEKFKNTVEGFSQKRFEVFLVIVDLLFVIVIFVSVQKDSKLFKNKINKKLVNLILLLFIIFLVYKSGFSLVELNRLHKDLNFYFGRIS